MLRFFPHIASVSPASDFVKPKGRCFGYPCLILLLSSTLPLSAQDAKTASPQIRWDRQTFTINGNDLILIGGSMHYFRIPEAEWEKSFRRIESDGFNIVDTYIPWFVHEPEESKFQFDNLEEFLALARKHHLYVVARPGPYINSETDQGGFPRWLSGKHVDFRSDSEASRRWTKHWYDAVMPLLARNQISRGGPIIMVQLENEYGHPQYISEDEKKRYTRFLIETASSYGFTIPFMGNDMQFAQDRNDPVLSKLYGTVDAYFDTYKDLEQMLAKQRQLNLDSPLGSAEYGLADPAATVRTMLGLGTNYLDMYLFRGGSQFALAAKGYESASYEAGAPIAEGGYLLPAYNAVKATAMLLRHYGVLMARSEPAPQPATVDDPEVWIAQRNLRGQGVLFVRSDVRGVSERTLALKSLSAHKITYHDPRSGELRVIPQSTTMLLRREQSRLMVLNLPVRDESEVVYSTAELLGRYASSGKTWLVFYGDPGEQGEVALSLRKKPDQLPAEAIWDDTRHEAIFRLQFGDADQIIPVDKGLSILSVSRDRAYRAEEVLIGNQPALMISNSDESDAEVSGDAVDVQLGLRHSPGPFTILSPHRLVRALVDGQSVEVTVSGGAQEFSADVTVPDSKLPSPKVQLQQRSAGFTPSIKQTGRQLRSLPDLGIWKKGVTRYSAILPVSPGALRVRFFTDDYKSVYVNGQFVPEISNRAKESFVPIHACAAKNSCHMEIYYVDTGRPKEDLGLWRLDEKKGLESVEWLDGNSAVAADAEWNIEFADLDALGTHSGKGSASNRIAYTFPRPQTGHWRAVWRAFMPDPRGLVYLNGVYVENHEPGREPILGRSGIYLPPSLIKDENELVFVAFDPAPPALSMPVIRPDLDSVRKNARVQLFFAAAGE